MQRKATIERKTKETEITIEIELDNVKDSIINSGIPFFDHMLTSMSKHGRFYLNLQCTGDIEIDDHHSIEDIGIVIGEAFKKTIGDKKGIQRFSDVTIPMDDTLTKVALDLSGRASFVYNGPELKGYISKYSEELTIEFLKAFTSNFMINLHVNVNYGENSHHIHESIFKALGRALYLATSIDETLKGTVPSSKGTI